MNGGSDDDGGEDVWRVTGLLGLEELMDYRYDGDPRRFFTLKLRPWCNARLEVSGSTLTIEGVGPVAKYADQLKPGRFAALKVRMLPNFQIPRSEWSVDPDARLLGIQPAPHSEEVSAIGRFMKWPIRIVTDDFGDLSLDWDISCFVGKAQWIDTEVELTIEGNPEEYPHASLSQAKALWADSDKWQVAVQNLMVAELLPVKSELRRDNPDAGTVLTREAFLSRAKLISIDLCDDGEVHFCYAGDLFGGQFIFVSGTVQNGPASVLVTA